MLDSRPEPFSELFVVLIDELLSDVVVDDTLIMFMDESELVFILGD
jgi:hypothetical protein